MDDEEIEEYDPYEKADYERDKQRDDDMLHALEYKNLYNRAVTRLNEVKKENEELKAKYNELNDFEKSQCAKLLQQIEKMRNCSNCKHCKDSCDNFDEEKYVCNEWELAE